MLKQRIKNASISKFWENVMVFKDRLLLIPKNPRNANQFSITKTPVVVR